MVVKEEILKAELSAVKKAEMNELYPEYFADMRNNWFNKEMGKEHQAQYARGAGGELESQGKGNKPPKMASLRSSSAMTYNILGNDEVKIKTNCFGLSEGNYRIEYEKQIYPLKSGMPANLDAFLVSGDHAVFCEMKMMEWICNTPGVLRSAYKDSSNYFPSSKNKRYAETFIKIIYLLEAEMAQSFNGRKKSPLHFKRYDAWQMLKHALAIYHYLSDKKFTHITLLNVVFEPSEDIFSTEGKRQYLKMLQEEHQEFQRFLNIIEHSELYHMFKEDCGVDFSIKYISAADFIECLEKTSEEREYLNRYQLK